jgi:hypothetical protein
MKNILVFAAATALLIAVPAYSNAATLNAGAAVSGTVAAAGTAAGAQTNVSAGATTQVSSTTAGTTNASGAGSLSGTSTYDDVTGSMGGSANANEDLTNVTGSSQMRLIKLSSLKGYSAGASMKMSTAQMASMRQVDANVAANAALTANLKASGYTPNDVVALSTDAKGTVTVFLKG